MLGVKERMLQLTLQRAALQKEIEHVDQLLLTLSSLLEKESVEDTRQLLTEDHK